MEWKWVGWIIAKHKQEQEKGGGLYKEWRGKNPGRSRETLWEATHAGLSVAFPLPWGHAGGGAGGGEVLWLTWGAKLVLPDGVQLLVLPAVQAPSAAASPGRSPLLCTQGLLSHHQVILQHVLLLPPPLNPRILNLSGFWNEPRDPRLAPQKCLLSWWPIESTREQKV